jgi:hypothetical protein
MAVDQTDETKVITPVFTKNNGFYYYMQQALEIFHISFIQVDIMTQRTNDSRNS